MRPELPWAVAEDKSVSIQPARSLFISWGKTVQTNGATSGFAIWCLRGISNFAESPVDNASPHHSEDAETDDFGYTHDAGYAAAEDDTEIELSLPYQDDFMFNEGGIC